MSIVRRHILYVADGLLRAAPVPPGQHTVELRFESAALALGIVVSSIPILVVVLLELVAFRVNRIQARERRL